MTNTFDEYLLAALLNGIPWPEPIVLLTVGGAGSQWDNGYQADMARALVAARPDLFVWQGVNYPAAAFPMGPSTEIGVTEGIRLLTTPRAFGGWQGYRFILIVYSEGAIVGSTILQRMQTGDLQDLYPLYLGATTFGNPMREEHHTVPGGVDGGGMGIVEPNNVNTPSNWWDFANDKAMVGSTGDDLYTKAGKGITALALADERAVWDIVNTKKISTLAGAIGALLLHPSWTGDVAAAEAAFQALGFFFKGLTPHTTYQIAQPVPGDPRDCWAMGYDHVMELGIAAQSA